MERIVCSLFSASDMVPHPYPFSCLWLKGFGSGQTLVWLRSWRGFGTQSLVDKPLANLPLLWDWVIMLIQKRQIRSLSEPKTPAKPSAKPRTMDGNALSVAGKRAVHHQNMEKCMLGACSAHEFCINVLCWNMLVHGRCMLSQKRCMLGAWLVLESTWLVHEPYLKVLAIVLIPFRAIKE